MTTGVNPTWRGRYKQNTSATGTYVSCIQFIHNKMTLKPPWLYVFQIRQLIIALFLDFDRDLEIEVLFVDVSLSLNTSFVMSKKSQKPCANEGLQK